jgi:hypothetical protein
VLETARSAIHMSGSSAAASGPWILDQICPRIVRSGAARRDAPAHAYQRRPRNNVAADVRDARPARGFGRRTCGAARARLRDASSERPSRRKSCCRGRCNTPLGPDALRPASPVRKPGSDIPDNSNLRTCYSRHDTQRDTCRASRAHCSVDKCRASRAHCSVSCRD